MENFSTYARYSTEEDASFLVELLVENHIAYDIVKEVNQLDHIYLGESLDQLYLLKVSTEDFTKVNQILSGQAKTDFKAPHFAHYFDQFDKNELMEVIQNPNDWNAYDNEIAKLFLEAKHQVTVNDTSPLLYSSAYQPERLELKWIIIGYVISFSIVGIFIGSAIVRGKKTLQNGDSVFLYDESTRWHAGIMILLGALGAFLFFARLMH